ncbi:uncharacterized protein [Linepithema humile]|uniref:uncharacterized protein isoform X2 n=1 Tax=Linepithema humile TaxID=83485 RepID=UPI000623A413|nr:PREDICTED: uncharacterized protein LOC105675758 isoform X1 [Linepithema humile]XP_012228561.1 PREDICTED: uncharacterized protein LOC105675758 isoform X1 [Linepithema humile]XP_012228562.1 PREDICTED: uncharacterized protein LOC105675758 isoform X1 [Linepithema humile]
MATDKDKRGEIYKLLLSLLLARQGSTPIALLDQDYYEMEGQRIPWRKFGHTDLVDFLRSAPQHFLIESYNGGHYVRGIASDKSKHVSSLVARQKSKTLPFRTQRTRRPIMTRYIPPHRPRGKVPPTYLHQLVQHIKNNPDGVSMHHIKEEVQKDLPSMTITAQDLRVQLYELSHQLRIDGEIIYPVQANDTSQDVRSYNQPPLMPELQNASSLVKMCAGGDEESDCAEDFADEENFIPAGCISNNYSKPSRVHERLAANFALDAQSSEQNAKFYYDNNDDINACFPVKNDSINMETMTDSESVGISALISQRTRSRLKQLVEKHPQGIWCADLPDMFLKEYNVSLNYIDLGFTSVREYASYLPDIFHMTQENTKDDFLLYNADKKPMIPEETFQPNFAEGEASSREQHDDYYGVRAQLDDNDDLPIPADVSPDITKRFAPDNVMNYNDSVDCILVTNLLAKKKLLKAYVIEVFNPSFFWIQLWENKKVFENFMRELNDFYKYNSDVYSIPKVALKRGLNCACVYANMWHRCIIKSVKPDYRVTVLFYDFGTLKTYAPEDVYYLHKRFSLLPAQAIPCGLYNIRPIVGDRWRKSVNNQFIDRIDGHNGLLGVSIKSIDALNNSMLVVLTDINEDGETDINEWLVKENLAKHGKMGDAVDMASLMKYVNNNFNQLPSYCFAEENPDRCQATSTEEMHAVPLISPKETLRDNNTQTPLVRCSVRPPPGFAPLGEQSDLVEKSTNFCNGPSENTLAFGNTEATTNPFLYDQQPDIISNEVAKSLFAQIWEENLHLQLKLTKMFGEMLEYTPLSRIVFDNHMKVQRQLNKIMKSFEKAMTLNNEQFLKSPFNPTKETTPNDVGSAQRAPISSTSEVFKNQSVASYANTLSNLFNVDAQTRWSQSDQISLHVQVPPTTAVSTTTSSTFNNYQLSADSLFSSQESDNVSPTQLTNSSLSNSDRASLDFLGYKNTEYAGVIKETNPFKLYMTGNTEMPTTPESQQTATSYDSDSGYLSVQNLQNHISNIATSNVGANFRAMNNDFASAGHVNVNGKENYSSRIVYEAGPVMYNTQKQQANTDAWQSTCNNNLNVPQNVSANLGRDGTELLPSSVNSVAALHLKQNDILRNDESYATRPPIDCMPQDSSSIINEELNYYQQGQANIPRPVSARAWRQVEIPEHWISSKFQNKVRLQDCKENCTAGTQLTPVNSSLMPFQDWNYNIRQSAFPNMKGTIDPHAFNNNNKEKLMDANVYPWNILYNPISNIGSIFLFQKIESIESISFIFHVDREGWMLVNEFMETFTKFKSCTKFIAALEAINIKIAFKEIERTKYPVQFSQLDSFPLNGVSRDSEKRISVITLISLHNVLSVLLKLKIISREEVDVVLNRNEFHDDSILRKIWTLLFTYREFKRRIEQYVNCRIHI